MSFRSLLLSLAATVMLAALGCRKASVASYRIPKEKDAEMPPALAASEAGPGASASTAAATGPASSAAPTSKSDMANTAVPTAAGSGLTWTAPATWKAKPPSAMRKGSYAVPGEGAGSEADLAITAFPGDVGGELANLNRWRGQVQLPPVGEAALAQQVERVEHNGLRFGVVDLTGPGAKPSRIVGAYVRHGDATWFFKLSGLDVVVGSAKPAFLAFLETVKPASSTP